MIFLKRIFPASLLLACLTPGANAMNIIRNQLRTPASFLLPKVHPGLIPKNVACQRFSQQQVDYQEELSKAIASDNLTLVKETLDTIFHSLTDDELEDAESKEFEVEDLPETAAFEPDIAPVIVKVSGVLLI